MEILMFNVKQVKRLGLMSAALALSTAAITTSTTTMASGSFSSGAGVGFQNNYNLGKSVFYKKLVCDDCEIKGSHLQRDEAKNLILKLSNDEMFVSEITGKDRQAVIYYITRRFKAG